jgi:hypothetical protein
LEESRKRDRETALVPTFQNSDVVPVLGNSHAKGNMLLFTNHGWMTVSVAFMTILDQADHAAQSLHHLLAQCYQNRLAGRTIAGKLCGRDEPLNESEWEDVVAGWIFLKLGPIAEAMQEFGIFPRFKELLHGKGKTRDQVNKSCKRIGRLIMDSFLATGGLPNLRKINECNKGLQRAPFKKEVYFSVLFGYSVDDSSGRIRDTSIQVTTDLATIKKHISSIDRAVGIRDRNLKRGIIPALIGLDLVTDAVCSRRAELVIGEKADIVSTARTGPTKRKKTITMEMLITQGAGCCACGHITCPNCSGAEIDAKPKAKKNKDRRVSDWVRDNLDPSSVSYEDIRSYTDAAVEAPVDLRAASIAYAMVVMQLNSQQTTLDGIVFPGDSSNGGNDLRKYLGLSGRPRDGEVMRITVTALMSRQAEQRLLELRDSNKKLRVNAVMVILVENVLSSELKDKVLDHKDELMVVFDDRHKDGIRAAVRVDKGHRGVPKTPLIPTGKRCVQAVKASRLEELSFELETKLLNWFIDETNHWVNIITGLTRGKTKLEKAVRQEESNRPGKGKYTKEMIDVFLVPRTNINASLGKYGISSSYGLHKDPDKMLSSPPNKSIRNEDGAIMPQPKHMMVSTNALGRNDYRSITTVEWVRKKGAEYSVLGELSTDSNCKHIQGIYANEYEIWHRSNTKVDGKELQDGSVLYRSRILDTYRQTLTPLGGHEQEKQYLERLIEEGRYKQKDHSTFSFYSHYMASKGTPVMAPKSREISANMWWREEVRRHIECMRDPTKPNKKEVRELIKPKTYLVLKKHLLANFEKNGKPLSLPAKTIGITRGHKWDHYRHHMLVERAIKMKRIILLSATPPNVSNTVVYTYENRIVPPGMPFSNYESPSHETDYKREVLDPSATYVAHIREKYRNPFAPIDTHHNFFTRLRRFAMGERGECPLSVVKPGSTKPPRLDDKQLAILEKQFYALPTIIVGGSGGSTNKTGTYGFSATGARSDDPNVSTGNAQECQNKVNRALMEIYERQSQLALFLDNGYFEDKRDGHIMLSYYRIKGFVTSRYKRKRGGGGRTSWEIQKSYADLVNRIDDGQGYLSRKDNHSNLSFLLFGALDFELEPAFDFSTMLNLYLNWMAPSNPYTHLTINCNDPRPIRVPVEDVRRMIMNDIHDDDKRIIEEQTAKSCKLEELERAVGNTTEKDKKRDVLKVLSRGVCENDKRKVIAILKKDENLKNVCSGVESGRFKNVGKYPDSWISKDDIFEYICSLDDVGFCRWLRIDDAYEGNWAGKYKFEVNEILPITVAVMGAVAARANEESSTITKEQLFAGAKEEKDEDLDDQEEEEENQDNKDILEAGDGLGEGGDRYITPPVVKGSECLPMPLLLRPPPSPNRDLDIASVYYREQVARRITNLATEREMGEKKIELQKFLQYDSYREPDTEIEGNLWLLWDLLFRAIILRCYGNIIWQETFYGWARNKHDLDTSQLVGIPGPNMDELERFIEFLDDGCFVRGNNTMRQFVSRQHDGEVNGTLKGEKLACFKYLRVFCDAYVAGQQTVFEALKCKKEVRRKTLVSTLGRLMNAVTREDDLFICHQAVADLEGFFIEFAGDVTRDSIMVGSGGRCGATMINVESQDKQDKDKISCLYTMHRNLLMNHDNANQREALLYEIAGDGELRSKHTGRPFSIIDTEHVCCKVYIAVTCSHSSRFAETPQFYKSYCWPPPGDPGWARDASIALCHSWSVIMTKLPKNYIQQTYPARLCFEPKGN